MGHEPQASPGRGRCQVEDWTAGGKRWRRLDGIRSGGPLRDGGDAGARGTAATPSGSLWRRQRCRPAGPAEPRPERSSWESWPGQGQRKMSDVEVWARTRPTMVRTGKARRASWVLQCRSESTGSVPRGGRELSDPSSSLPLGVSRHVPSLAALGGSGYCPTRQTTRGVPWLVALGRGITS